MNSVLRLRGKLFHLINLLFYGITFFIGYLVGGGKIEKISDIFNLFSK